MNKPLYPRPNDNHRSKAIPNNRHTAGMEHTRGFEEHLSNHIPRCMRYARWSAPQTFGLVLADLIAMLAEHNWSWSGSRYTVLKPCRAIATNWEPVWSRFDGELSPGRAFREGALPPNLITTSRRWKVSKNPASLHKTRHRRYDRLTQDTAAVPNLIWESDFKREVDKENIGVHVTDI